MKYTTLIFCAVLLLLISFPLSTSAYPTYVANSDLVVVGPYDTARSGSPGNWGTGGSGSISMEAIVVGHKYRIRQDGTINRIKLYTISKANLTGFYLKIWRKNGSTYDLVGTSNNILNNLVAGDYATVDLATPITGVQEGDYYGMRVESNNNAQDFFVYNAGSVVSYYVLNQTATSLGMDWGSKTPIARVMPIELYMTAPQVVFIGDSIISGSPNNLSFLHTTETTNIASTIEKQFSNLTNYTYQNMGIGGQTTADISSRFTADIINLKPKVVVIEGGVNDIATSVTKSTFIANWTSMLDAAQASSYITTIIILKILPWTNGSTVNMQTRDDWNTSLATLATGYSKAIVVDASSYVGQFRAGGDAGNLWDIQTAYNADGVHFNSTGHGQIAQALADALPKPSATFDNNFSTWNTGNVTVNYNLIQTGGSTNTNISQTGSSGVEYSTDGSTWSDATKGTGGDVLTGLTSSASPGTDHSFVWDTVTDLPTTEDSTVYLRIRPNDGTTNAIDWTISNAFGVDNANPSTPIANPSANTYNLTQSVTLSATGSDYIKYSLTETPATCSAGTLYSDSTPISIETSSTIYVRSCDNAGNSSTASFLYTIDITPPETPIAIPSAGLYNSTQSVALSAIGSDYIKYDLSSFPSGCSLGTSYGGPISVSESQTIFVRACDNVGNSSTANFEYTIDTTVPLTPVATPSSGIYNTTKSVALSAEGSSSIRYSTIETPADCASGTLYSDSTPIEVSTTETIYVRACDLANNSSIASFLYTIDTISPSTPIATPVAGLYDATKSVALSAEGSSYIKYSLTETPATCSAGTAYEGPISVSTSETIYARACDDAGNSSTENFTYIIDTTSPEIPIALPDADIYTSAQIVVLTAEGSDSIKYSTTEVPESCSAGTLYSDPISVSSSETIYVRACDNAGNSSTASFAYVISINHTTSGSTLAYRTNYIAQQQALTMPAVQTPLVVTPPIVVSGCTSNVGFSVLTGESCANALILTPSLINEIQTITRNLQYNSRGNDVKLIQTYLNKILNIFLQVDGIFGPKTKSAVIKFQKAHGLVPDGIVGPLTRGKMK